MAFAHKIRTGYASVGHIMAQLAVVTPNINGQLWATHRPYRIELRIHEDFLRYARVVEVWLHKNVHTVSPRQPASRRLLLSLDLPEGATQLSEVFVDDLTLQVLAVLSLEQ